MRVLLVSTYDLGRQPFGIASPAAWLRAAGLDTVCVDTSRDALSDGDIRLASLVAFYLPMHTATRLAVPLIERVRGVNPQARICAYGLYAPLNVEWLRSRGVHHVLGPEAEEALVRVAREGRTSVSGIPDALHPVPRLRFIQPDRSTLPALARYASVVMPDGTRRVVGSTDATRGCKHLCRHCPVVPVYQGQFRVVPVDIVLDDIRAQVNNGAEHISFGDPDFLNGPSHARRVIERLAAEFPHLTYDATIKVEHLAMHRDLLPLLRETGCLFVTSAVESIDDAVLLQLQKGHTRKDFVDAVALCRDAGLLLNPTFIPFTPWTTIDGYIEMLGEIERLQLIEAVAPVQLTIRLLITSGSPLLQVPDIAGSVDGFDAASLTWRWRHADPRVDALQQQLVGLVAIQPAGPRGEVFAAVRSLAYRYAGLEPSVAESAEPGAPVPHLTEPWYCCAEPL